VKGETILFCDFEATFLINPILHCRHFTCLEQTEKQFSSVTQEKLNFMYSKKNRFIQLQTINCFLVRFPKNAKFFLYVEKVKQGCWLKCKARYFRSET